jgi:hypothetical protein
MPGVPPPRPPLTSPLVRHHSSIRAAWPAVTLRALAGAQRDPMRSGSHREVRRGSVTSHSIGVEQRAANYQIDKPMLIGEPGGTRTRDLLIKNQRVGRLSPAAKVSNPCSVKVVAHPRNQTTPTPSTTYSIARRSSRAIPFLCPTSVRKTLVRQCLRLSLKITVSHTSRLRPAARIEV